MSDGASQAVYSSCRYIGNHARGGVAAIPVEGLLPRWEMGGEALLGEATGGAEARF